MEDYLSVQNKRMGEFRINIGNRTFKYAFCVAHTLLCVLFFKGTETQAEKSVNKQLASS